MIRKLLVFAVLLGVILPVLASSAAQAQEKGREKTGEPLVTAKIAELLFKKFDADKNGRVTKVEYEKGTRKQFGRVAKKLGKEKTDKLIAERVALFKKHDKNAAGMNREEFTRFLSAIIRVKGGKSGRGGT